jgi:hypothetical protein
MSKLENKRRRAAKAGVHVAPMRENKFSEERGVVLYNAGSYRRPTHVYVYDMVSSDGNYMVYHRHNTAKPLAGLTYRQAIQLAYMIAFRRKGF